MCDISRQDSVWACEIILLDCIRYLCPGDKTPSKQSMGIEICVQDLSAAIFQNGESVPRWLHPEPWELALVAVHIMLN